MAEFALLLAWSNGRGLERREVNLMLGSLDVIFLAGGPRPAYAEAETGCSVCWYPISRTESLLHGWVRVVAKARDSFGLFEKGDSCLVVSRNNPALGSLDRLGIDVVCERRAHRGTAGVIRDNWGGRPCKSGAVLVIEPAASPVVSLGAMLSAWVALRGRAFSCLLGESGLGRYCGVMLCDAHVFDLVPKDGFFDLKEQLLPAARAHGGVIDSVVVAERARRVQSRAEWLALAQAWSTYDVDRLEVASIVNGAHRLGKRWSLISDSARTRGANIVESIVMAEAVIEPGALVARSVIGPGMRVPAGTRVVDAILADPAAGEAAIRRSGASGTVSVASE